MKLTNANQMMFKLAYKLRKIEKLEELKMLIKSPQGKSLKDPLM